MAGKPHVKSSGKERSKVKLIRLTFATLEVYSLDMLSALQRYTDSQIFWENRACANSLYQALSLLRGRGLGTRLVQLVDSQLAHHSCYGETAEIVSQARPLNYQPIRTREESGLRDYAANEVASNPASFFLFLGEAGFEATNEDALKLGYPSLRPEQLEVAIQFYLAGMFLLSSL